MYRQCGAATPTAKVPLFGPGTRNAQISRAVGWHLSLPAALSQIAAFPQIGSQSSKILYHVTLGSLPTIYFDREFFLLGCRNLGMEETGLALLYLKGLF